MDHQAESEKSEKGFCLLYTKRPLDGDLIKKRIEICVPSIPHSGKLMTVFAAFRS